MGQRSKNEYLTNLARTLIGRLGFERGQGVNNYAFDLISGNVRSDMLTLIEREVGHMTDETIGKIASCLREGGQDVLSEIVGQVYEGAVRSNARHVHWRGSLPGVADNWIAHCRDWSGRRIMIRVAATAILAKIHDIGMTERGIRPVNPDLLGLGVALANS